MSGAWLAGTECAGPGGILHGLTGASGRVEAPEDRVVRQVPVSGLARGFNR